MTLELLLAEQDILQFLICWSWAGALNFILHHSQSALDRGALFNAVIPPLQMGKTLEVLTLPIMVVSSHGYVAMSAIEYSPAEV